MRMKKFVQTASYLPYFISWVIAANIFLTFLSGDGVVNDILQFFHFTDEDILVLPEGALFLVDHCNRQYMEGHGL